MYPSMQENRGCVSGSQGVCCEICIGVTSTPFGCTNTPSPLPPVGITAARRLAPVCLTLIYKSLYMPRKKLPSRELRTATITTKITSAERIHIQEAARKCGLTPSEYIRQRAIGYEPPSALTSEEKELLHNLDNCRVDIVNYANALAGMKHEQRMAMFNRVPFMLEWYKQIIPVTNAVNDFINSVVNGGRIQKRTITNLRKLNK